MNDKIFVDSNIWVYFFINDENNKNKTTYDYISKNIKDNNIVISYQVINEVCNVLKRKQYTEREIRSVADNMAGSCEIHNYSIVVINVASDLREIYSFSYWDSQIVASAVLSGCNILASEDMQDGLRIGNLIILNPFKNII